MTLEIQCLTESVAIVLCLSTNTLMKKSTIYNVHRYLLLHVYINFHTFMERGIDSSIKVQTSLMLNVSFPDFKIIFVQVTFSVCSEINILTTQKLYGIYLPNSRIEYLLLKLYLE